jgi:hypothetical protein
LYGARDFYHRGLGPRTRPPAIPEATVPSTHGIEVRETSIEIDEFMGEPVPLNIWDFGGKEICHGTHALFL